MPWFKDDAGHILLALGVAQDEAVFGTVLRHPDGFSIILERFFHGAVVVIVIAGKDINRQAGVVLTGSGRRYTGSGHLLSLFPAVTIIFHLRLHLIFQQNGAAGKGAVGADELQVIAICLGRRQKVPEWLGNAGVDLQVKSGIVADEFPELPTIDEKQSVTYELKVEDFKEAVSQTIIACSSDTTRPMLTGVNWHTHEGNLYLASTDGYRLAERRLMKSDADLTAIIPASTLQEVMRSLSDNVKTIQVLFDDSQVCFNTSTSEIVSRLIDGKFPDYRQLIPQSSATVIEIKKADFSRITKIASLFARDSGGGVTLSTSSAESKLSIHSIASELGENTSEATATVSEDGQITINSRYLMEVLGVMNGEEMTFSFNGKLSPCLLQEKVKDPNYLYIIMPMKS